MAHKRSLPNIPPLNFEYLSFLKNSFNPSANTDIRMNPSPVIESPPFAPSHANINSCTALCEFHQDNTHCCEREKKGAERGRVVYLVSAPDDKQSLTSTLSIQIITAFKSMVLPLPY